MSEDEDTAAIALGGGLGSTAGSVLAGLGSFTLGGLALAAGVGAALGYGSYHALRRFRSE